VNSGRIKPILNVMNSLGLSLLDLTENSIYSSSTLTGRQSLPDCVIGNKLAHKCIGQGLIHSPQTNLFPASDHRMILLTIGKKPQSLKNRSHAYQPNLKRLKQSYHHRHRADILGTENCILCKTKAALTAQLDSLSNNLCLLPSTLSPEITYRLITNSWNGIIVRCCGRIKIKTNRVPQKTNTSAEHLASLPISAFLNVISRKLSAGSNIPIDLIESLTSHFADPPPQSFPMPLDESWEDTVPQSSGSPAVYRLSDIEVAKTILHAKLTQGINQENIPIELLKLNPLANGCVLNRLFTTCLSQRSVPTEWNRGKLVPIYKGKGDRRDASNYRPITLVATTRKIFELSILRKPFMAYEINQIQGGFRKSRGCLEQLALVHNFLSNFPADKRDRLCIISLEIKGAYDNVNRNTLMNLISRGTLFSDLADTLKSLYRTTNLDIYINGSHTGSCSTSRGTQQGGPASPFLFNYYMNPAALLLPMISSIESLAHPLVLILFFADDILFIGPEHIREPFLNGMQEFAVRSNLTFSAPKCIYIGNSTAPVFNGVQFSSRVSAPYLGTIISLSGISDIWQKSLIARSYKLIDKLAASLQLENLPLSRRAIIYKAFVRSSYEYLCQLGNLLGNNEYGIRKLFKYSLTKILHLPPKSDPSLLWLLLGIEDPIKRITRLQWLWYKKLSVDNQLFKHILSSNPLFTELTKPDVLRLDRSILLMYRQDKKLHKSSAKSLSLIFLSRSAWSRLEQTSSESSDLLKQATLPITQSRLDLMPLINQAQFFILENHVIRNRFLESITNSNSDEA